MPTKILMSLFTEIEKSILKFIWNYKRLQTAKVTLSKRINTRRITIPDLKLYYRATYSKKKQHITGTKIDMQINEI
jgi:hypothetical protein